MTGRILNHCHDHGDCIDSHPEASSEELRATWVAFAAPPRGAVRRGQKSRRRVLGASVGSARAPGMPGRGSHLWPTAP